jgi:hypothetical protein
MMIKILRTDRSPGTVKISPTEPKIGPVYQDIFDRSVIIRLYVEVSYPGVVSYDIRMNGGTRPSICGWHSKAPFVISETKVQWHCTTDTRLPTPLGN